MEDFVTWVDTSKLKRTVMAYNDEVSSSVYSPMFPLTEFSSTILICYELSFLWQARKSAARPHFVMVPVRTLHGNAP